MNRIIELLVKQLERLKAEKEKAEEAYAIEKERENAVLKARGHGYGMRHTKIGFSTRKSDRWKEKIEKAQEDIVTCEFLLDTWRKKEEEDEKKRNAEALQSLIRMGFVPANVENS